MKTNKKEFTIYMVVSFVGAWILQIIASTVLIDYFKMILGVTMFVPMIAVLIAKKGLGTQKTGIGWRLNFKKNWKMILVSWFIPAVITLLGAVVYFTIFRDQFDPSYGFMIKTYEASGVNAVDGVIMGIPIRTMILISCIQVITYAPLINCFFAVGEEIGWRGYMTPALVEWCGNRKGVVLSGIIWGLWHAPVIALAGYEYGKNYWGAPVSGVVLFCVFTTAMGIILSWTYTKTNSIWIPAIFHGAINAAAAIPMCFTDGTVEGYLLGPVPNGLIAGIPMIIFALIIFIRMGSKQEA